MIPQIDFSTYANQIIWLVVIFIMLFIIFTLLIVPSIEFSLKKRMNIVNQNCDQAKHFLEEVDSITEKTNHLIASMTKTHTEKMEKITLQNKDHIKNTIETFKKELLIQNEKYYQKIQSSLKEIEEEIEKNLDTIIDSLLKKSDFDFDTIKQNIVNKNDK